MDRRAIRNKKSKTRNARPYDRPNQQQQGSNQGILGRVASKVKGLLNPSWIFNVGQWMSTPEETRDTQDEESADEEEAPPPPASNHRNKRLRMEEERVPPISTGGTETWINAPSSSIFHQTPHLPSTVCQSSLIDNNNLKESAVVMNGDDHSENSEGSASTSGCSSLVSSHKDRLNCIPPPNIRLVQSPFSNLQELKAMRRDVTSPKEALMNTSRLSLWSGNRTFSPAAKLQRRSPSVLHTNQPSFNISTFAGPSNKLNQQDKKVSSPFYQGKTTFGGASSSRRMPISVAPYQLERPQRNQIKVHRGESEDSLEGMSSAAKRILMTLEQMSSPVTDAKKIPNTNRSPVDLSLYFKPPKLRSSISTARSATKGPPIANISTISKLTTLKSCATRRTTPNMESFSLPVDDSSEEVSERLQSNALNDLISIATTGGGGGKMRCKITQKHQPTVQKEPEITPLPDVPLPISKLPTFSFEANCNKNASNFGKGDDFVFSSPIEMLPKPPTLQANSVASSMVDRKGRNSFASQQPFTFSSPIEPDLPASNLVDFQFQSPASTLLSSTASNATWECTSCWIRNAAQDTICSACEVPRTVLKLTSSGLSSAEWKCQDCWIMNPSKETRCMACEIPRHNNNNVTKLPVSASLQNANTSSPWKCEECWIMNLPKDSCCASCETPRSNTKAVSSMPSLSGFTEKASDSSTWECQSCWIRNPIKEVKCLACETAKCGFGAEDSSKTTTKDSPVMFDLTTGGFKIPETLLQSAPKTASFGGFKLPTVPEPLPEKVSNRLVNRSTGLPASKRAAPSPFLVDSTLSASKETVLNGPSSGAFSIKSAEGFSFGSVKENTNSPMSSASHSSEVKDSSEKPLSSMFTVSGWECDACFVRNTPEKRKCVACDTLKPTKSNTTGFKDKESFKMNSPLQNSPITFKFGAFESASQTTTSTTSSFGVPSSTIATPFFTPVTSSLNTTASSELSKCLFASDSVAPKPSVPDFKFDASKMPTSEAPKPTIPVINLVDENDNSSELPQTIFGTAASKITTESTSTTDSAFKMTPVSSSQSFLPKAELKWPATITVKEENPTTDTAKASDSKTNKASTETPSSGFNFKLPSTMGASAFSGFSTIATSANDSKQSVTTTTTDPTEVKPLPFTFGTPSTAAMSSPFGMPSPMAPVFKMADKNDVKTSTEFKLPASSAPVFNNTAANSSQTLLPFQKAEVKSVAVVAQNSTNAFTFGGNTAVATITTQSNTPQSGFSFFASTAGSTSTTTTPSSLFMFGGNSNVAQTAKQEGFNFKPPNQDKPNALMPNAINFSAATTTTAASPSVFKFGTPASVATSGFSFGAVKTEPISAPSSNFSFGSGTTTTGTQPSTFSAFQTSQPAATTSIFPFGGQQPASNPIQAPAFGATTGAFAFGNKSNTTNQMPAALPQASSSMFSSGTVAPMFGGGTAANPVFGAKAEKSAGFNFGTPQAAASQVFQFGSAEKKQAIAPQFNFGTPQEAPAASQFQSPQFTINTPANFNFGAGGASTQGAAPFQFIANSDNTSASSAPRKIRKAIRRVNRKE